jgi:hypothetical protein
LDPAVVEDVEVIGEVSKYGEAYYRPVFANYRNLQYASQYQGCDGNTAGNLQERYRSQDKRFED